MVPIARKDKNHVITSNRPPSRSRNLNTYERLRSRSRSGNRISGQREQNRTRSRSMNKISGQREKNRMRTRSRSENRISGQREISHRSPARRGRSPLGKKKGSQDLSQINNRLLNLVHDQYGHGVADHSSEDQSGDRHEF